MQATNNCDTCPFAFMEYVGGLHDLMCGLFQKQVMGYLEYHDNYTRKADDDRQPINPPEWCKLPVTVTRSRTQ